MQEGDLVRFAKWDEINASVPSTWPESPKTHIGVLIRHDKILGTVEILYEGELINLRSVFAEKAGKKDYENR